MSAVQSGRVVDGGSVHIRVAGGRNRCAVLAHRNIAQPVKPSAVTAETICGHCRSAANLEAVELENTMGVHYNPAIAAMIARLVPATALSADGFNPAFDAERAAIAATWAAFDAPVVEVRELTALGQAAARIGAVVEHKVPRRAATRRTARIHNSFAKAA